MLSLLRSLSIRYLLQKKGRSSLVAVCIMLGVAMVVSTRLLNECTNSAALDTTIPVDQADLYIHNGELGVDRAIVDELRAASIPGLRRVEPFVVLQVELPELDKRSAVVFGADVAHQQDPEAQDSSKWRLSFTLLENPFGLLGRRAVICRRLYEERKRQGKRDIDPIELRSTDQVEKFNLVGVFDVAKDSPVAPYADKLILMDVADASKLMRRPERVSRIDLFLDKGAKVESVRQQVANIVGTRASVRTAEENRKSTQEIIGGVKLILNLCSLGSIIVGLFLVYISISVTVAERRHDIGVMRSLGATRTQIASLFTLEAMMLGALGALPGIPLGLGLAELAISVFGELTSAFLNSSSSFRPVLTLPITALAIGAGLFTAFLAAIVPAMQAASDQPADAVRRAPSAGGWKIRWLHRLLCLALVLAGVSMILVRKDLPSRMGAMIGMALIPVGLLLAMPIFVSAFAKLLLPVCRWLFGVEIRLAADNMIRSPGRTGIVTGVLAAGVSLMFLTAGVGKSNQDPIEDWLKQVIRADAYLFRGNIVSANSSMTPMEPSLRDELAALPGVERVVGLRFSRYEYGGTFILMIAMDARDYQEGVRAREPEGLPALDQMRKLEGGNYTIVSDNFAAKWKVKEGDFVSIQGPHGTVELKVVGVGRDYSWSQGTIFMDRKRYAALFGDPLVDAYHVFFKLDADHDTTYETVHAYADRKSLLVQNRESVHTYLAGMLDKIFQIAYLQQMIVAIVAALGVVMALLISVLQRRRELGLLRAVGATQGQVLKTVIAEATLMGLLGTILGFVIGMPMEWFVLRVLTQEETGFVFDVLIPWREALGIGAISIFIATLAGLFPALHAVRMRITDAIAYE